MSASDALFEERLKAEGLDRESFLRILEGAEARERPDSAPWQRLLQEVLDRRHEGEPLPAGLLAATGGAESPGLPFSGFFHPFLRLGAARLRARMGALPARERPGAEVEAALLESLVSRLHSLASRTLILELNVARMMDQLPGETPQERFRYFSTTWLEEPGTLGGLLEEYPVLARLLATVVERWVEAGGELLARLAADRAELGRMFFAGRDPGALSGLELGLSDPHRGGRGVALLRFSSGLRLVYKPKSLAIERWFQRLLGWLNAQGLRAPHRTLAVLERDGYGWVELVEASGCESREGLRRFYWRQGSLLALLHVLSATDFHLENLIAAGEHPVPVDLEALFHHRPSLEKGETGLERAQLLLSESVLSVGLLPMSFYSRAGRAGVDLSGLGGAPGQLTPHPVPMVEDAFLDTMRVVRRQGTMDGASNRPRLGNEPANAADFTEDIVQGFEETWSLLARRREALPPLLREAAGAEVRQVLRATQRYGTLLQESTHPDFLRDGLERDKVLDNLWAEAEDWPALRRALPFEHADLLLGDIPLFTARPGQQHLWSSGGTCIPDFFARDSLGEVLERLSGLDEQGCARQVSFIRQAMLLLEKGQGPAVVVPRPDAHPPRPVASPEELLKASTSIGEALAAQAIRGRTDACWIGVGLESLSPERWGLSPLRTDLYDGVGGLALFFAFLAAETGRGDFEALARAALEPVRSAWREREASDAAVGPFVGRSSAVYVLGQLAALWNEPALLEEALAGLPSLEPLIDADGDLDLLSGAAGCAVALLGLHRQTGEPRPLALARRCGERLLATAAPGPDGSARWSGAGGGQPLLGFSHGTAGIAWALLELAAATGDGRYREAARRAMRYERAHFSPERGNWPDLRQPESLPAGAAPGFMAAWCHGAPGIALGRLLGLRHLDEPEVRDELRAGLETTLREGGGGNHSLCHGELGNLEVLHLAGEVLGEPGWRRAALEGAAEVLREGREGGWRCGLPKGHQTPGLMVGLAGIGFGLLRLAAPDRLPSLSSLGPPIRGARGASEPLRRQA